MISFIVKAAGFFFKYILLFPIMCLPVVEEEQQWEGIPTGERLDHCETGENDYCQRSFRKMPHRRATDTEPMDRILIWAVQLQGQWRSISTELSRERHRGWPSYPSQRRGGCSTITEEREVSWSRQHPSRTGPSRWRGCNHRAHDNLQQDLADTKMANPMDPVLSHHTSRERQPAAVPELPNNKPHQSPKQSHAEDHTEQIEATSEEDHCWRTGRLQNR